MPPETIWLHADRLRLTQIVSNLIDNAVKYTPEPGHIWVAAARTGDRVSVSVRDTGIGIPPEQLRGIFDLFKQLDRAPEHAGAGIGLGLALVRSLAGMHGGTVEATSDGPGQGSQFTLRLPVWSGRLRPARPKRP